MNLLKIRIMRQIIICVSCLILMLFLMNGCKHAEKIVIEKRVKPMWVRRVIRLVNENAVKYNTLSVRKVSLVINNDGNVSSIKAFYKIKRDSVIQVSAQYLTIPVGKLELDKDSFRAVYHRGKLVMTGTMQNVSDLVGNDIDYQTVQSILSNHIQPVQPVRQDQKENQFKDYVLNIEENMYKISSIRERKFKKISTNEDKLERFKQRNDDQHLVKQDIFVDPELFIVRKVIYNDINSGRIVTIEFSQFKPLGDKLFPENIHIFMSGKKKMDLQIELSRISIDDENDFGFSIPVKYKREKFKESLTQD